MKAGFAAMVVLVGAALAPTVTASGTLGSPAGVVELENGHSGDCADPGGLCLISLSGSSPGAADVDAYQRVDYVGFAPNDSYLREAGVDLLPDGGVRFYGSDLYVRQPVFRLLAHHVGTRSDPTGATSAALVFSADGFWVEYVGPALGDPTGAPGRRQPGLLYGAWVSYERLGPFNDLGGTDTDSSIAGASAFACDRTREVDECRGIAEGVVIMQAESTPKVRYGLEIYEAEVGFEGLRRNASSIRDRTPADLVGQRLPLASPGGRPQLIPSPPAPGVHPSPPIPRLVEGPTERMEDARSSPPSLPPTSPPPPAPPAPPSLAPYAIGFALAVALAAMYSRLTREEALASRHRAQMIAILQRDGPQRMRVLADALRVDRTTIGYHARLLAKLGEIVVTREGRATILGLPGQDLSRVARPAVDRAEDGILAALSASAGALPRTAVNAAIAAFPPRTRAHAIRRLVDRRVVLREWDRNQEILRFVAPPRG